MMRCKEANKSRTRGVAVYVSVLDFFSRRSRLPFWDSLSEVIDGLEKGLVVVAVAAEIG